MAYAARRKVWNHGAQASNADRLTDLTAKRIQIVWASLRPQSRATQLRVSFVDMDEPRSVLDAPQRPMERASSPPRMLLPD